MQENTNLRIFLWVAGLCKNRDSSTKNSFQELGAALVGDCRTEVAGHEPGGKNMTCEIVLKEDVDVNLNDVLND